MPPRETTSSVTTKLYYIAFADVTYVPSALLALGWWVFAGRCHRRGGQSPSAYPCRCR